MHVFLTGTLIRLGATLAVLAASVFAVSAAPETYLGQLLQPFGMTMHRAASPGPAHPEPRATPGALD